MRLTSRSAPISLRQLFPDATLIGAEDILVSACSSDSRDIEMGDLFVGLSGTHVDGHDFADQAIEHGATAVLAERFISTGGLPLCIVSDSREAYGQLCQALAGNPSRRVKTIGVTGTNGKTTTVALIASVLEAAGHQVATMGTLGCWDGTEYHPTGMTTPPAPVVADWLARAVSAGCSHAVLEVSSHALAQRRTSGIELDAACVTNVTHDHLDFHNTLQNYRAAKRKLFDQLSPEGFGVVNADDAVCRRYLKDIQNPALTFSLHDGAEVTATIAERCLGEQTLLISAGTETAAVQTRMLGEHHAQNCLVAASVGLIYALPMTTIARGLEAVDHVPGRLERLDCGQSFGVFVDYAHTPDALDAALNALRSVTEGRLICVFGAGGDRDREKRPKMAAVVEQYAQVAILTTDNPRTEEPERIAADIAGGFSHAGCLHLVADRTEAIATALSLAGEGDCVLIAGKGHENYQLIGRRKVEHDDRETARQWLYAHAVPHAMRPRLRLSA